jgi:hypothetical protein
MAVLTKPAHEQFAQLVVSGKPASQAYTQVYGEAKGADQSASRLLRNAKVRARISELGAEVSNNLLSSTIRERENRLRALEFRHEQLMQVVRERGEILGGLNIHGYPVEIAKTRGEDLAAKTDGSRGENDQDGTALVPAPGAHTGFVCLDWRGREAQRAVWKVDTGLLAELRHIEEQIAREKGEWNPEFTGAGVLVPVQVNVTFVSPANG